MKKVLILSALLIQKNIFAAPYPANSCVGKVSHVGIYSDGRLTVSNGNGVHYLCNINTETNSITPEVCKSWHAIALAAHAANKDLAQFYNFDSGQSCSTVGNWSVPNPVPYFINIGENN